MRHAVELREARPEAPPAHDMPAKAHDPARDLARYRRALSGEPMPLAMVDLDAVDRNIEALLAPVRAAGKTLRLATKSIRSAPLLRYLLDHGGGVVRGLMAYAAAEVEFLASRGFDDILLAYPISQRHEAKGFAELSGRAEVSVVVDCDEHLRLLDEAGRAAGTRVRVVVEVDMAYRALGGRVRLGVLRSPLEGAEAALALAGRAARLPGLALHGVMGYEAQVAGLGDESPHAPLMNGPKRLLKRLSRPFVAEIRARLAEGRRARGLPIALFNGGGTGSLSSSASEPHLTELAAGSGFLCSHLFDHYAGLALSPAAFFVLPVVRLPRPGVAVCAFGGYVASGEVGLDKAPLPWLPAGLRLTAMEGAGEVQTPLLVPPGLALSIGDGVFFRHAKAGELAERFARYLLVRGEQLEGSIETYRGEGRCFG